MSAGKIHFHHRARHCHRLQLPLGFGDDNRLALAPGWQLKVAIVLVLRRGDDEIGGALGLFGQRLAVMALQAVLVATNPLGHPVHRRIERRVRVATLAMGGQVLP